MTSSYTILAPNYRHRRLVGRRSSSRVIAAAVLVSGLALSLTFASYISGRDADDDDFAATQSQQAELALPSMPEGIAPLVQPANKAGKAGTPTQVAHLTPKAPTPSPVDETGERVVRLERGDTLIGLLMDLAVPSAEAHEAMAALKTVYNPKDLTVGREITVLFDDAGTFSGFAFEPNAERSIKVERHGDRYAAAALAHPLTQAAIAAAVKVDGSFYESGVKAGIPSATMTGLTKLLSYSVDFQRDVKLGDSFRVIYEEMRNPEGVLVRTGDILYAEMTLSGRTVKIYRHKLSNGDEDFYDEKGQTLRRSLLRTPVNAARITSGFGMRQHPLLGYTKMHRGMDFGAPQGTPIYASGDGVVVEQGWKNGYGNYTRIRHNDTIQTAYAHMKAFASNVQRGARVRQGQVIGYVGTTGNSTGPHLHYEVLINGAQVNPASVAGVNMAAPLTGTELARFKAMAVRVTQNFQDVPMGQLVPVSFTDRKPQVTQAVYKPAAAAVVATPAVADKAKAVKVTQPAKRPVAHKKATQR